MTPDKESLLNYKRFDTPLKVKLADDGVLFSYGKGDVQLIIMNDNNEVKINLKDVLFVPKIQNKLFSLPSITEKGAAVEFQGQACGITIDGKKYTIGHKHGKLYKLDTTVPD